jgi:tetratricopeptide (TPR) repeat protein
METPDLGSEFKNMGNIEFSNGNYAEAVEFYTQAMGHKRDKTYFSNRAFCFLKLNQFELCVKDSESALEMDPKFSKALCRRAQGLLALGRLDLTIESLKKALEVEDNDPSLKKILQQADILKGYERDYESSLSTNDLVSAIRKIEMILETCTECTDMEIKRLELWNQNGDHEKSITRIRELDIAAKPISQSFEVRHLQAQAYLYRGNTEYAKKIWKNILLADPDMKKCQTAFQNIKKLEAMKDAANQLFKDNKLEEALQGYLDIISVDPFNRNFNSLVYGNISSLYIKQAD